MRKPPEAARILIVRRENIGDLVCTTPLISLIRQHFPHAHIACLVNTYNVHVLDNNPEVDVVHAYQKFRHTRSCVAAVGVFFSQLRLFFRLRWPRFDYAFLATTDFLDKDIRLLRAIGVRQIVAIAQGKNPLTHVDVAVPYSQPAPAHIVEQLCTLAAPFSLVGPLPPLTVKPDPRCAEDVRARCVDACLPAKGMLIGIHISSRSAVQRWPADSFATLIRALHAQHACRFLLFWSPGAADNQLHPGDDDKAAAILAMLADLPVAACPTTRLDELIAGLSLCDAVICSDGGAMHLAAGLQKPILALFGNADPARWRPWQVPHVLLRPESHIVADIHVEEAMQGFNRLLSAIPGDKSVFVSDSIAPAP